MPEFVLTPVSATILFVLTCLAGYQYRRVWKTEGPVWQLWMFGAAAAAGLCVLGFVPMRVPA